MSEFIEQLQAFVDAFAKNTADPFDDNFVQFAAQNWADSTRRGRIRATLARLGMAGDARGDFEQAVTAGMNQSPAEVGFQPLELVLSHGELLNQQIPPRFFIGGFIAESSISMVFAARGRGKTRFSIGLACAVASGAPFLSWDAPPQPSGALYVDGEMPLLGLQDIARKTHPDNLSNLHFLASERFYAKTQKELRLATEKDRDLIDNILSALPDVKLLVLDNISCLFPGIREDKKEDWEPVAAWLIRLRHRGIATLLVHHSGKGGDQRGTSGREDALDNVVKLSAPPNYSPADGCHFHLSFEKGRFLAGEIVKPIDVRCIDKDEAIEFEWSPIENHYLAQARDLIMDGLTSTGDIAAELGITKGYASKLKKRVENGE